MRNNVRLKVALTAEVLDSANSGTLTVDSNAYAANDYFCDGYIAFNNVFPDTSDGWIELKEIIVRESISSGTINKPALKLYFFDSCDLNVVKNQDFDYADGTSTTLDNLLSIEVIASTDFLEQSTAGNVYRAFAHKSGLSKFFKGTTTNKTLYCVPVINEIKTMSNTPTFSIEIKYKQH
jgi:hypothetical protein